MNNINILRKKLDKLLTANAPYSEIYDVSMQIDNVLLEYYLKFKTSPCLIVRK